VPNLAGDSIRCLWEIRTEFNEFRILEQLASGAVIEVEVNDRELTANERRGLRRLDLPPGSRSRYVRFLRAADRMDLGEAHRYYHPNYPKVGTPWDPKYWYHAPEDTYLVDPDPKHVDSRPCPDCEEWKRRSHGSEHLSLP
jgi:hypothetical protein